MRRPHSPSLDPDKKYISSGSHMMADTETPAPAPARRGPADLLRAMEIDLRLVGMVGALLVIWIVLDIATGGTVPHTAESSTCWSRPLRWPSWPRAWFS